MGKQTEASPDAGWGTVQDHHLSNRHRNPGQQTNPGEYLVDNGEFARSELRIRAGNQPRATAISGHTDLCVEAYRDIWTVHSRPI